MSHLLRMVYVSTSTSPVSESGGNIQVDVGRILMQSRKNNPKIEVGGVLYFSNNYFFQCLEGEQDVVNDLYQKISLDPRHTHIQSLSVKRVNQRHFSNWSMKYVASEDNVTTLLEQKGLKTFNPYEFDEDLIEDVLRLFTNEADNTSGPDQNYKTSLKNKGKKGFLAKFFNWR